MRGCYELYKLHYGDLEVKCSSDGMKYVEFTEQDQRLALWSTPEKPGYCPVLSFEAYVNNNSKDVSASLSIVLGCELHTQSWILVLDYGERHNRTVHEKNSFRRSSEREETNHSLKRQR